MTVVLFAAAAVVGTLARALTTSSQPPSELPWKTLGVNCVGAFVLGFWFAWGRFVSYDVVVAVAGLGSLTTFSTVAGEAATLLDDGRRRTAMTYVGLTVIAGIAAAKIGLEIGFRL